MVAGSSIAAMSRIGRAQRGQRRTARPKVRLKRTLHERRRARPGSSGPRKPCVAGVAGLRRGSAATNGEWAAVAGGVGRAEADAPASSLSAARSRLASRYGPGRREQRGEKPAGPGGHGRGPPKAQRGGCGDGGCHTGRGGGWGSRAGRRLALVLIGRISRRVAERNKRASGGDHGRNRGIQVCSGAIAADYLGAGLADFDHAIEPGLPPASLPIFDSYVDASARGNRARPGHERHNVRGQERRLDGTGGVGLAGLRHAGDDRRGRSRCRSSSRSAAEEIDFTRDFAGPPTRRAWPRTEDTRQCHRPRALETPRSPGRESCRRQGTSARGQLGCGAPGRRAAPHRFLDRQ